MIFFFSFKPISCQNKDKNSFRWENDLHILYRKEQISSRHCHSIRSISLSRIIALENLSAIVAHSCHITIDSSMIFSYAWKHFFSFSLEIFANNWWIVIRIICNGDTIRKDFGIIHTNFTLIMNWLEDDLFPIHVCDFEKWIRRLHWVLFDDKQSNPHLRH
jgi:hypothetical protein